jgi:hypothetical protein
MDFIFDNGGLGAFVIVILLILGAGSLRIKDCLNNKRSFLMSSIISLGILLINWTFGLSLFLGCGHFGGYIKSLLYIPLYLQHAYLLFCFVGGMYLFSKFYLFGHKFYINYRDKGIFSFKYKGKIWY